MNLYDFKTNTDGWKGDESAGFGSIIRDSLGESLIAAYGGCHPISVSFHELQGVKLGPRIL